MRSTRARAAEAAARAGPVLADARPAVRAAARARAGRSVPSRPQARARCGPLEPGDGPRRPPRTGSLADLASGRRSGVRGTPTLFINGARYDGLVERGPLIDALARAALATREPGSREADHDREIAPQSRPRRVVREIGRHTVIRLDRLLPDRGREPAAAPERDAAGASPARSAPAAPMPSTMSGMLDWFRGHVALFSERGAALGGRAASDDGGPAAGDAAGLYLRADPHPGQVRSLAGSDGHRAAHCGHRDPRRRAQQSGAGLQSRRHRGRGAVPEQPPRIG